MERLALLLIAGRGVPQRDHKRAVQLMTHALSQISSGQAKIGGVSALLKQLVLTYRILFLRLCDFLKEKLSVAFIERGVRRIRDRVKHLSRIMQHRDHFLPSNSHGGSAVLGDGTGEDLHTDVGTDADSEDSFVRSAISFPNRRYSGEETEMKNEIEKEVDKDKDKGKLKKIEEMSMEGHGSEHGGLFARTVDRSSGNSHDKSKNKDLYLKNRIEVTAAAVAGSGREDSKEERAGSGHSDTRSRGSQSEDNTREISAKTESNVHVHVHNNTGAAAAAAGTEGKEMKIKKATTEEKLFGDISKNKKKKKRRSMLSAESE